jgi:hypothetical protein
MYRFFIFSLGLLLIAGCKKKNISYKIVGSIYDQTMSSNLSGATVELKVTYAGTANAVTKETTQSGSDGSFTFELERDKIESITVVVSKNGYFQQSQTFNLDELSVEEENILTFQTKAKAWVALHFTGDGTKTVKYFRSEGLANCSECCPSGEYTLTNVTDQTIVCINNGNTNYGIYYMIVNETNYLPLSINTPAFDTTEMAIPL